MLIEIRTIGYLRVGAQKKFWVAQGVLTSMGGLTKYIEKEI